MPQTLTPSRRPAEQPAHAALGPILWAADVLHSPNRATWSDAAAAAAILHALCRGRRWSI